MKMVRLRSSMLFDISLLGVSPCRRLYFFLVRRNFLPTTGKKTDTESLSDPNDEELSKRTSSYDVHVPDELTANVLFAVAENYPSFGKAQRWRCRSGSELGFIIFIMICLLCFFFDLMVHCITVKFIS
ncbi:hypothetical protein [Psychromonas algicola]|uniref:hypothetical protein n=1 Tax=Psychromonas algicola TaxID=2555642 RepID=UPI0010676D06|nr:hypothetical protein [Psychromonas sp. RZ5]TEW47643.1 hypothetical protein E2R67_12120 [Psychromonas sp. RZ5]